MENLRNNDGSDFPFTLVPTPQRTIFEQFVDYETGYLVALETSSVDRADRRIFWTLVDRATGAIITPAQRRQAVAEYEVIIDLDQWHCYALRTIDETNGLEEILSSLTDMTTGRIVSHSSSTAFAAKPRASLLERHLQYLAQRQQLRADELKLAQQPFEERCSSWCHGMYLSMRMQSEAGYDMFAYFTPEAYQRWHELNPDIDRILEFFLAHFLDDESYQQQILQRIGKAT